MTVCQSLVLLYITIKRYVLEFVESRNRLGNIDLRGAPPATDSEKTRTFEHFPHKKQKMMLGTEPTCLCIIGQWIWCYIVNRLLRTIPGKKYTNGISTRVTPPQLDTPLYIMYMCIGWVGVGWRRHCETCRSLREIDNQGACF